MLCFRFVCFYQFLREETDKLCVFVPVLGKIYELLGVLAEVHPSDMVNNSDKLYKAYLGELKEQVRCLNSNGNFGSVTFDVLTRTLTPDDVVNTGAKTLSGGRMPARNHCANGELLQNHRRRSNILLSSASYLACFYLYLAFFLVKQHIYLFQIPKCPRRSFSTP